MSYQLKRAMKKDETQEYVDFILDMREKTNEILSSNNQKIRVTVEREIERLESGETNADYSDAFTAFRVYRTYCSDFALPEPQRPEWLTSY